jgi:hypothetical protein
MLNIFIIGPLTVALSGSVSHQINTSSVLIFSSNEWSILAYHFDLGQDFAFPSVRASIKQLPFCDRWYFLPCSGDHIDARSAAKTRGFYSVKPFLTSSFHSVIVGIFVFHPAALITWTPAALSRRAVSILYFLTSSFQCVIVCICYLR